MPAKFHKQDLRNSFQIKRDSLSINEKKTLDDSINKKLIHLIDHSDFQNIHVFLPMRSEQNIFPFINHLLEIGLNVVSPKSLPKGQMENYVLKSTNELSNGIYGTSFPANSEQYFGGFDLIVIPGLAYSLRNERLGYGGGYYDRFLKNHPNAINLAPAYDFQIVDSLPTEIHDIKMNQVITP